MSKQCEMAAEIYYITNKILTNTKLSEGERAAWLKKRNNLKKKIGLKSVKDLPTTSLLTRKLLKLIKDK